MLLSSVWLLYISQLDNGHKGSSKLDMANWVRIHSFLLIINGLHRYTVLSLRLLDVMVTQRRSLCSYSAFVYKLSKPTMGTYGRWALVLDLWLLWLLPALWRGQPSEHGQNDGQGSQVEDPLRRPYLFS